jgi:hypothetical protein
MRPADVLQHLFAEHVGIAFVSLGQGNDFVGDCLLTSSAQSPVRRAKQVISRATPMTRVVSWSKFSPLRNSLIGMLRAPFLRRERNRSLSHRRLKS